MKRTPWLAVWVLAGVAGLGMGAGFERPAVAAEAEVDPAAKQLQATHGLFKRGLFKEASEEYARFLKEHASHPLATEARYGLAIALFRQDLHKQAIPVLQEVLKDPRFSQRDEALAVLGHCFLSLGEHARALAALDELLEKHPDSRHAQTAAINRVQVLYLADKKREALDAANEFLARHSQSGHRATALYFRALAQQATGDHQAAGKSAAELIETYPGSGYQFDARLILAQSLEARSDLDRAIEAYRDLVKAAPPARIAEARYSYGAALYKATKYDQALREFSAVVKDSEQSTVAPAARLQLGLTQVALGRYPEARKTLGAVAQSDPARSTGASYGLAQCDLAEKKFDAALARIEKLADARPPPVEPSRLAFDRAVALMGLERFDEAAKGFAAIAKDAPQAAEAAYRLAYCLHRLGKYDQSQAALAGIDRDSPLAAAGAELGAENLFLTARYDQARAAYEALLSDAKDDERRDRLRMRLGQTAYYSGKYEEAIRQLAPLAQSKRILQDPQLAPALLLLGDAMLQTRRNQESAAVLAKYVPVARKDEPEARFKLALAQLRAGDEQSAEQNLSELIQLREDSPWITRGLFEYGQLQFTRNHHDKAAEALRKVLEKNPAEELAAPAAYMLAWIDLEAKRYDAAAKAFEQITAKHPKHALASDAVYQRGVALREAGKGEQAAELFGAYVSAHPDGQYVSAARQMIASSLNKAGKPREAVRMLSALAGDAKTISDAVLYELAWAQRGIKDEEAAARTYERLIEQYPQSRLVPAARAELGDLLVRQGQAAQAIAQLEKVADARELDAKTLAVARYQLASAFEAQKDWKKAAAAYGRFVKDHPDHELTPSALYQGALASMSAGRLTEARESLAQLVAGHASSDAAPVAMLKLGEVQSELKDYDAAAGTYQQFLSRYPDDKFAYLAQFGAGWALENQKQYDQARSRYEKVIAGHNGPTAARAQFQVGETWFAQGKFDDALKALLAVEDVYGKTEWAPRALYEAGRALEQLKQPDKAKEQYQAVVEKYKDAPEAALAAKALQALNEKR